MYLSWVDGLGSYVQLLHIKLDWSMTDLMDLPIRDEPFRNQEVACLVTNTLSKKNLLVALSWL